MSEQGGGFRVCSKQCGNCLFGKDRIVSASRMKEVVKSCIDGDKHFICHEHSIVGQDVMCRGYYDRGLPSQMRRIAERLGVLRFVDTADSLQTKLQHEQGD